MKPTSDLSRGSVQPGEPRLTVSVPAVSNLLDHTAAELSRASNAVPVLALGPVPGQAKFRARSGQRYQCNALELLEVHHKQVLPVAGPDRTELRAGAAATRSPGAQRSLAVRAEAPPEPATGQADEGPHPRGNAPRRGGSSALATERRVPP